MTILFKPTSKHYSVSKITSILLLLVYCYFPQSLLAADPVPTFQRSWGNEGTLNGVTDIAIDAADNIYVLDSSYSRVTKFSKAGVVLTQWGGFGNVDGTFNSTSGSAGIGLDSVGNVYVNDISRLQKFTSNGVQLDISPNDSTKALSFSSLVMTDWSSLSDVAIDASGSIYVVDSVKHRVRKLSATGQVIANWGSNGAGNGQFNSPSRIAVHDDFVYVADTGNRRIQRFSLDGDYQLQWTVYAVNGAAAGPVGIATDSNGKVYVSDPNQSGTLQRFSADGVYEARWGSINTVPPSYPVASSRGIGVDSTGFTYAVGMLNSLPRIVRFDATGVMQITGLGYASNEAGKLSTPTDVALDSLGNVYVADSANNRIQKFDSNGSYLAQWTNFSTPYGIVIDDEDTVFIVEKGAARLQKRDVAGQPIGNPSQWNGSGTLSDGTTGTFNQPVGLAIAGDYVFTVEDGGNARIQVFNKYTGARVAYRANNISGIRVAGIAVDSAPSDGSLATVYISVANIFTAGVWKYSFGIDSSGNGQLTPLGTPWLARFSKGLAVDNAHNIYITDISNTSAILHKYNTNGTELVSWASQGVGKGQITTTQSVEIGIFVADDGDVYTTDTAGNGRVQVFSSKISQLIVFDVNTPSSQVYGDAPFDVVVTGGTSGNPVILSSSTLNVCTVSGNRVTVSAVGVCTLVANQAGSSSHLAASEVTKTITVTKAPQLVSFGVETPTSKTVGDSPFEVSVLGGDSGNPVILSSSPSSVCT
ncbi:MAG: hypothetical protein E6Q85_01820, partial [Thiothrix sp.]